MIRSFANQATGDIFNGVNSRAAGKVCPVNLHHIARRKLDQLNAASRLDDLRELPKNRLEALTDDRDGQHSIRINGQYRVCFRWTGIDAEDVEVVD